MEAKAGEEIDAATPHRPQLAHGVGVVSRLAEDLTIKTGHLVAADDQGFGVRTGDRFGLRLRQAERASFGSFIRQHRLVDAWVCGFERQAQTGEQFASEGGGRGENQRRLGHWRVDHIVNKLEGRLGKRKKQQITDFLLSLL